MSKLKFGASGTIDHLRIGFPAKPQRGQEKRRVFAQRRRLKRKNRPSPTPAGLCSRRSVAPGEGANLCILPFFAKIATLKMTFYYSLEKKIAPIYRRVGRSGRGVVGRTARRVNGMAEKPVPCPGFGEFRVQDLLRRTPPQCTKE